MVEIQTYPWLSIGNLRGWLKDRQPDIPPEVLAMPLVARVWKEVYKRASPPLPACFVTPFKLASE
jgi:hypothetical protein